MTQASPVIGPELSAVAGERSRRNRLGLYLLASLPLMIGLYGLAPGISEIGTDPLWVRVADVLIFPLSIYLIGLRKLHPLGVAVALTLLLSLSFSSLGFWAWAVISMAAHRRWRWVWLTAAATLSAVVVATIWIRSFGLTTRNAAGQWVEVSNRFVVLATILLPVAVTFAVLVAAGFYVSLSRALESSLIERASAAAREQSLLVAQSQAEERARIAREMHDVLAHRISLVSMHAGALAFRQDLDPDETREIAEIVRSNAAEALDELRGVLGLLRQPGEQATPSPTLADLPTLLEEASSAGARIVVTGGLTGVSELPASTSRHAYRLLQEALTNARKHAAGSQVEVSLTGGPGEGLTIEVSNPMSSGVDSTGAGVGLIGLQERTDLVGGRFSAGPVGERFVVQGWLPWAA